ncbi:class I adenylate-forming enzyme family protein [Cupriavidus sp. IDO]|uniref:class I adenylate-forming enzyme family protein n=1 Tax=Cupriavidus sp. IDO TaxID=1539142 RepID=UPI0005797827|nr:AMP-binding protein [Cupriavidus sp. IDO]KWR76660.1 long-chain fatty acid--CoA ligase [Cupriavidus sp. IDO]
MSDQYSIRAVASRRIHEVIEPWVASQPQALALVDRRCRLTYGELATATREAAVQLRELGVRPGDRLMLVAENCAALAVLVLAASQCDAWAVVVNARLSPREIDNFVAHSAARRVLYASDVSKEAAEHADRAGAVRHAWPYVGELAVGPLNEASDVAAVSEDPVEQVAAMIYTSGTSGQPKGVTLTHANLLYTATLSRELRHLGPADGVYGVLPMAHVVGLSSQLIGSLSCGCTLYLEERFSPETLVSALREGGVTILIGVPAMYARLLDWCARTGTVLDGHGLRVIGTAGAPLTPELKAKVEAAFGMPLQNGYGLTEMSPTIAQTPLDRPRQDCSVGPPVPGVEVRIVDVLGNDVVPGGVGELWVRGPNLMKGYYRDEAQTRAAINPEGWLNTGDLARQEDDGALFIVGRTKELIIRSGFNVYPVEVEQVLNSHPAIVQSAVVGRQVDGNEEVVAFVELADGVPVARDMLEAYLRERLSPYKVPTEIRSMTQLPAAPTGKLLKGEMKRLAASAADARQTVL